MAQVCGAKNKTRPGYCKHEVRHPPCWQHRGLSLASHLRPPRAGGRRSAGRPLQPRRRAWAWLQSRRKSRRQSHDARHAAAAAGLVADVLLDGLEGAVADRVVDYLGTFGHLRLKWQARSWATANCQVLADTAQAVLVFKADLHEAVGEAASEIVAQLVRYLADREVPRFVLELVKKIAAKVPLPSDAPLAAVARGLQLIGIYLCLFLARLDTCPCLLMFGRYEVMEQAKEHLRSDLRRLLNQTAHDLHDRERARR
jgi:hypothetical protein